MLNRLYIAVGVVIILILSAAFVAPFLINWEQYRTRLESVAEQGFGASVAIRGGAEFRLLPQPRMIFEDVVIGPIDQPLASVRHIQADFKLVPFLGDRFELTNLLLVGPHLSTNISSEGEVFLPFNLPEGAQDAVIKVENLQIQDGQILLFDQRRAEAAQLTRINGLSRLGSLFGPYTFSGSASYEGQPFDVRLNVGEIGTSKGVAINLFVEPEHGQFSVSSTGLIEQRDGKPIYIGKAKWRTNPVIEVDATGKPVSAQLVEASVELNGQKLVLPELVLVPDDQRPASRLNGSASVVLGNEPAFDLKLTGSVFSLTPKNILTPLSGEVPELIRFVENLPPLPAPTMPGRVKLELSEFDTGLFSIRDMRLDATTKGGDWRVLELIGSLPGQSAFLARGTVGNVGGHMAFAGRLAGESSNLDGLAKLWRDTSGSPTLVRAASLSAELAFGSSGMSLSNATLFLEQSSVDFDMAMRLGADPGFSLNLRARTLEKSDGEILAALFQSNSDMDAFGAVLKRGDIDVAINKAKINDLNLDGIVARGGWNEGGPFITVLKAGDIAGLSVDLVGDLQMEADRLTGEIGGIVASRASIDADLIAKTLNDVWQIDTSKWAFLSNVERLTPFSGKVQVLAKNTDGAPRFVFGVDGIAAGAEIALTGEFAGDLSKIDEGESKLFLLAKQQDVSALQIMFGTGQILEGTEQGLVDFQFEGKLSEGAGLNVRLEGVREYATFDGVLRKKGSDYSFADGIYDVSVTNGAPLLQLIGANELPSFPLVAKGKIELGSSRDILLEDLNVEVAGQQISGRLALPFGRPDGQISGNLKIGEVDLAQIMQSIMGMQAMAEGPGIWPIGPLTIGQQEFAHRGQVHVEADTLVLSLTRVIDEASFDFGWNENSVLVDRFEGKYGEGSIGLSATFCCTGKRADIGLTGRINGDNIALRGMMPEALSETASGTFGFDAKFESAGASVEDLFKRLGGEGVFSVGKMRVAKFSPTVFSQASEIKGLSDKTERQLEQVLIDFVESGPFSNAQVDGDFSITNGKIRVRNLTADDGSARLFGDARLDLENFNLEGNWTLSNLSPDSTGLNSTAQVRAEVSGPMNKLQTRLNVSELMEALRAQALVVEIERLEKLRAEQDARDAAQRVIDAEKAKIANELAIVQAQEAAVAKAAAEKAAAQLAAEEAAQKAVDDATQRLLDEAAETEKQKAAQEEAADATTIEVDTDLALVPEPEIVAPKPVPRPDSLEGFEPSGAAIGLDDFE